jgi:hypothetical protein
MVYEPEKNEGRKPQKKRKKEENIISLAVFWASLKFRIVF